jgi:hypothetical protein
MTASPARTPANALRHRGADPEDGRSFSPRRLPALREAVSDLSWLLNRGYGIGSASELVGDRYRLSRRQRVAVASCACSDHARELRQAHQVSAAELAGKQIWLDGFNVLTMVETALGGGVILLGRDGCCRDVAGVYAHYHRVKETEPALQAIGRFLSDLGISGCRWWLDSPVSNCGRLQAIIWDVAQAAAWPWEIEMVTNPDRVLSSTDQIVASSDHVILDRCQRWFNLTREVIRQQVPSAWILDLGPDANG